MNKVDEAIRAAFDKMSPEEQKYLLALGKQIKNELYRKNKNTLFGKMSSTELLGKIGMLMVKYDRL